MGETKGGNLIFAEILRQYQGKTSRVLQFQSRRDAPGVLQDQKGDAALLLDHYLLLSSQSGGGRREGGKRLEKNRTAG